MIVPRWGRMAGVIAVGTTVWLLPAPEGVGSQAWSLFSIFVGLVLGIMVRPLPTSAMALIAVGVVVITGTVTVPVALSGFSDSVVWLVVAAFFLTCAFARTGLGVRLALHFLRLLGRTSLGLGYGLVATDLVLSTVIPSNAARAGGVILSILRSLGAAVGSEAALGTSRKISAYLTVTAYQGVCITSAMFLTSTVVNPLVVQLASQQGVTITWGQWAAASAAPGLASLLLVPWLIFRLYPPEMTSTPWAGDFARERLRELGPVSRREWILLCTLLGLLGLWAFGGRLGISTTGAALAGLAALLLTGVLDWDDLLSERNAWDTFIWFAVIVMMAGQLAELGMVKWFSGQVAAVIGGGPWLPSFAGLCLIYFYSHYFFASNTAHVVAMYGPFLGVAIGLGTPPMLGALVLGFFSSLFACTTHYGTAPGPMFFSTGNVELPDWWRVGAVVSVAHIILWLGVGGAWWKVLGLW